MSAMAFTQFRPLHLLERIGQAVIDVGFGGFLEKFEDHLGRRWTKALVILVGLAVAVICGSVIWTYLLLPIAQLIPDPRSWSAYQFAKLVVIVALFLMITNQLLQLLDNYLRRGLRNQLREKIAKVRRLHTEATEALQGTREAQANTRDMLAAADLAFGRVIEIALERELITEGQADELRSLADEEELPTDPPA